MCKQKILFIDRDGTIISEPKDFQIDSLKKLMFEPHVINVLYALKKIGYKFVMITNQDYLGTKKFQKKDFNIPHNMMLQILKTQEIFFEKILICPHSINDNCICRKPKIKLVEYWLLNNLLDKKNCYVIGDRNTDIQLAHNMGITGIKYNKIKLNWNKIYNIITESNRYFMITRNTKETNIIVKIWLDKRGKNKINTGINFFDHMLQQICIHSGILMYVKVQKSDLNIDDHHIIEDIGIVIGEVLLKSLGNKIGINRFGFVLPMDDCLAYCVIDASNRPFFKYRAKFNYQYVGDMNTQMIEHFFRSISYTMSINLYLRSKGKNDHHKAESLFKAFGKTLNQVIKIEHSYLPSSKGLL